MGAFAATGSEIGLIFLGEILGTMLLIILGNGVVASVKFKNMFAKLTAPNWVLITFAWGFAVLVGVIVAQAFKAPGYLNPAVTVYDLVGNIGVLANKGKAIGLFLLYVLGQFIGAMLGQVVLNFINWNHIKDSTNADLKGSSCTGPAYANATGRNFSYEFVGTAVLIGVILAIGKNPSLSNLGPIPVTLLVVSIGMSLGSSTGYAINPARDLGPRMVYALTQKFFLSSREQTSPDFKYGLIVPGAAPMLAGILIGLIPLALSLAK
ncbi:aquaporin family protein [Mycoplasma sp. NEAQ87857]|uniref:MIP/aquaporin family protein n=1 Tax=Mycoplasma sp. NEAQ87857 TaxID=2683967 RepID=UPI0013198275|nr:MIP/aquaporin family protein [Mycoplasma sp. NEAQ87857]QGZ97426.1 aquaporin family protein [Mycoplasma sp. NEAQ87857]